MTHTGRSAPQRPALREGFTTGSAAAAAAKAATLFALTGRVPQGVDIPLPPQAGPGRLSIPVHSAVDEDLSVRAAVVKDGGDDPDATHGARIEALVTVDPAFSGVGPHVLIDGGAGVGRATLPGLPVAVGRAAINPGPEAQIRAAVLEALPEGFNGIVLVVVEVPEGEELARRTLNQRLGIVGGISILGTGGIVRPYSHKAWADCLRASLDVAAAQGLRACVCATGRRSERLFLARHPEAPEFCCLQAADHFALALREAAARGFGLVVWAVFFGKLAKQAQGLASTHARDAALDFALLARRAQEAGASPGACAAVAVATTASQAHALLGAEPEARARLTADLVRRAREAAKGFAPGVDARWLVFDIAAGPEACLHADPLPEGAFLPAAPLHPGTDSR